MLWCQENVAGIYGLTIDDILGCGCDSSYQNSMSVFVCDR